MTEPSTDAFLPTIKFVHAKTPEALQNNKYRMIPFIALVKNAHVSDGIPIPLKQ
jgi:hypothetical protein